MEKIIKIILAISLLLCLLDMPYGYYMLIRWVSMMIFMFLAYQSYKGNEQTSTWIYVGLALLFQPYFKIALGRVLWNIVDVIVALGLLITSYKSKDR